jgi:hypothetical protein
MVDLLGSPDLLVDQLGSPDLLVDLLGSHGSAVDFLGNLGSVVDSLGNFVVENHRTSFVARNNSTPGRKEFVERVRLGARQKNSNALPLRRRDTDTGLHLVVVDSLFGAFDR